MTTIKKLRYLIAFYLATLLLLLVFVTITPLVIRRGFTLTREFIIQEGIIETGLIAILLSVSYFIFKGFRSTLKTYGHLADQAERDKSKLISRLAEAFNYIGTVNVEIKEIQSLFGDLDHYPQTHREFKTLFHMLSTNTMAVARTPWALIRIIDRGSGRTIHECAVGRTKEAPPLAGISNRAIIEHRQIENQRVLRTRQQDLDFETVCILPAVSLSEEQTTLINVITHHLEMNFLLFRAGTLNHLPVHFHQPFEKENSHATHN
jgi:hypothetical protein